MHQAAPASALKKRSPLGRKWTEAWKLCRRGLCWGFPAASHPGLRTDFNPFFLALASYLPFHFPT